jgi:hypothetical protein
MQLPLTVLTSFVKKTDDFDPISSAIGGTLGAKRMKSSDYCPGSACMAAPQRA